MPSFLKLGLFFKLFITILVYFSISGCIIKQNEEPSFLIIAIDRLGADSISCSEYLEKGDGGFYQLCDGFVHFKNAYTTSVQSPAALASIFTGQYPILHGLRHPESMISFENKNLALSLEEQGYKTAFFSGGDPITSYQGLERGFQSFTDFNRLSQKPEEALSKQIEASLKFISETPNKFLLSLYIPALRSENSFASSFEIIEQGLDRIFSKLKKEKKWHNTFIVVTGLQGALRQSYNTPWPVLSLKEKNIKVETFIKPATKPRDKEISNLITDNISLADVGLSLFEFFFKSTGLNQENKKLKKQLASTDFSGEQPEIKFSKSSLLRYFKKTNPVSNLKNKRTLLVETAWSDWRYGYAPLFLLVEDQYRVFLNKDLNIFNTLLNKESNQFAEDQIDEDRWFSYIRVSAAMNSDGIDQFKKEEIAKLALGYKIWGQKDYKYPEVLEDITDIIKKTKGSTNELWGWVARLAAEEQDCRTLYRAAIKAKKSSWSVAARMCTRVLVEYKKKYRKGCLKVFFRQVKIWPEDCEDPLLHSAWNVINSIDSEVHFKKLRALLSESDLKEKRRSENWKTYLSSAQIHQASIGPNIFDLYYLSLSKKRKKILDKVYDL